MFRSFSTSKYVDPHLTDSLAGWSGISDLDKYVYQWTDIEGKKKCEMGLAIS